MLRRMRGKRVYMGSDGHKITIHTTTDDGLMFLFLAAQRGRKVDFYTFEDGRRVCRYLSRLQGAHT